MAKNALKAASWFLAFTTLGACLEPPVDRLVGKKSNAPTLYGIMEGTVVYIGPRPHCQRDDAGTPTEVTGRAVLLLFEYDNPPPPTGAATTAENLIFIPGADLFAVPNDCMPANPTPAERMVFITRSAPFIWPLIEMGADYQIRAIYDNDGDFIPIFSVTKSATAGDVVGGDLVDPSAAVATYSRRSFGTYKEYPKGQIVKGVTVTIGAPVNTEPPMFRMADATTPLSAETALSTDPELIWSATQAAIELIDSSAADYAATLAAAAIARSFEDLEYAWYVKPVDADGDGSGDPHPVLGSLGIDWYTPIMILKRKQTVQEASAGVPGVLFIGSVMPTDIATKSVFSPSMRIMIPPVAVIDLDPRDRTCRIPYLPPGNLAFLYEGKPTECHELPTGRYDINVLHGVAAGIPVADGTSDTGQNLSGGIFPGQAWSIPNELGPPDLHFNPRAYPQLAEEHLIAEQGPAGRFTVYEPDATNPHTCDSAIDPFLPGIRDIVFTPLPAACCVGVAHLCGITLCETVTAENGETVREITEDDLDEDTGLPTCLPFEMPRTCCE